MRCQRCGQHGVKGLCGQCQVEGGVPGMTRIRDALTLLPTDFFSVTCAQDRLGYYYNYTLRLLRYLRRSGLVENQLDQFKVTLEGDKLRKYESIEETTKEVMKVIREEGEKGITSKEVAKRIGRNNGVAYNILKKLTDEGILVVCKEEQPGSPKVNMYYLPEDTPPEEEAVDVEEEKGVIPPILKKVYIEGLRKDEETCSKKEQVELTNEQAINEDVSIRETPETIPKPEPKILMKPLEIDAKQGWAGPCNCSGRWHTLKNRLIQAGELEALQIMVQIEERE